DALTTYVLTLASPGHLSDDLKRHLRQAGFVPIEPPRPAPALDLCNLAGRRLTLAELRGQWVMVNFWGTTCVPCLAELPHVEQLAEEFRPPRQVVVLSVCADETDRDEVRKVGRRRVQRLPLYVSPDGQAPLRYDVQILPTAVLIDPAGRLVGKAQGGLPWSGPEVRELLHACLAR